MSLRKAAEQALEALHNIDQSNNDDAIEALRQALEQPKREWVGLTREDKDDLVHALPDFYSMEHVILATEAKLKEKNG